MSELFNGSWQIDLEDPRGKVWDPKAEEYVRDTAGREDITLRIEDGVQHYEVLFGLNPTLRMVYSSRYDDTTWVPYTLVGFEGVDPEDADAAIADLRRRTNSEWLQFKLGEPVGMVRTILVDDRTHYRVSRSVTDGSAQYVMLRRMAEDNQSYVSVVMNAEGLVQVVRVFRPA